MDKSEIISIVVTFIGLAAIGSFFTILFNHYAKGQMNEIKCGKYDDEIINNERYDRSEKAKRNKKNSKIFKNIVFYAALAIIIPLFVFSLISRVSNNVMNLSNKSLMVVASGSMSEKHEENNYLFENQLNNQFQTYDIIILEKVDSFEELELYDVIAYLNDEEINVIHRIIEIDKDNGKYVTRGDANDATDKYHPTHSDVIGRYTGVRIPGIGMFVLFLQSYFGIITVLSLMYCLIMFDKVNSMVDEEKNKRVRALELVVDFDSDEEFKKGNEEIVIYGGKTYRFSDSGRIEKIRKENNEVIIEGIVYDPKNVTDKK